MLSVHAHSFRQTHTSGRSECFNLVKHKTSTAQAGATGTQGCKANARSPRAANSSHIKPGQTQHTVMLQGSRRHGRGVGRQPTAAQQTQGSRSRHGAIPRALGAARLRRCCRCCCCRWNCCRCCCPHPTGWRCSWHVCRPLPLALPRLRLAWGECASV